MRLLDRYLLRELLIPLAYCFSGFLIFWVAFDLFSELDYYQENQVGGADVAAIYLLKLPGMLYTVLPVALLLALLYALTNHARHNEVVAMRAAGVSLWRLTTPYLAVGVLCGAFLFLMNDVWFADSHERAEQLLRSRHRTASEPAREWQRNLNFHNDREGRLWQIGGYHPQAGVMTNILVDWQLPGGARKSIEAQRALWTNDQWLFLEVRHQTSLSSTDTPPIYRTNELVVAELNETPQLLNNELKIRGLDRRKVGKKILLSLKQIRQYIALHPNLTGDDRALILTQWYGRLAQPWTCVVVVLIAIPFAVVSGKRNVFVGVAASVFICFSFFVLSQVGLALGTSGRLPPWLAAWLPNLLFGGAGLAMVFRAR
jgi:lipopolysaccharide export system permease protein